MVVLIAVLQDYDGEFGLFARMWCTWCVAVHHTLCVFGPNVIQLGWQSTGGMAELLEKRRRIDDGIYKVYVIIMLIGSLIMYGPRVFYDVLAGLLQGPTSIALIFLCLWSEFSPTVLHVSLVVLCIACSYEGVGTAFWRERHDALLLVELKKYKLENPVKSKVLNVYVAWGGLLGPVLPRRRRSMKQRRPNVFAVGITLKSGRIVTDHRRTLDGQS
ncbi:Hypothetical protein PHPALM_18535 [Phytophthora palmivora]|uniref:Uncharacterized protein n=1 Tax=Phytophthora palmivora TaxID=4796 RepID=A0A2P4XJH5_9STRA|nr:Hypothetical protein PHPALM_18535 [Phytophthora palmivora]